jgi:hypothetical protein
LARQAELWKKAEAMKQAEKEEAARVEKENFLLRLKQLAQEDPDLLEVAGFQVSFYFLFFSLPFSYSTNNSSALCTWPWPVGNVAIA